MQLPPLRTCRKDNNPHDVKQSFHAEAAAMLGPILRKVFQIKKVQRRTTRMMRGQENSTKSGRLKNIKLFGLKRSRLRRYLIRKVCCKTEKGIICLSF